MKEDIDEILVNCLNKEPLTDKEQRILEEWKNISAKNEKFGGIIQKLKQHKNPTTCSSNEKETKAYFMVLMCCRNYSRV